jgi:glucokinase
MDGIESLAREVIAAHGEPEAIGIGVPSQIDFATGTVVSSTNIPLAGVPLREEFQRRFGVPVFVDNDANCAALCEAWLVDEPPARNLMMLTLGTGVGGGAVTEGRVFRGSTGLGAEFGHVVIDWAGPPCQGTCPNRGCLETLCSGTALEREGTRLAAANPDSPLGRIGAERGGRVKGTDVVAQAREGDLGAQGLLDQLAIWLGCGIASYYNVFEPEHFVIGGGLSVAADLFLDRAVEEARGRVLPGLTDRVAVTVARGGPDAGVIGAGLLAALEHAPAARSGDNAIEATAEGVR